MSANLEEIFAEENTLTMSIKGGNLKFRQHASVGALAYMNVELTKVIAKDEKVEPNLRVALLDTMIQSIEKLKTEIKGDN